MSAPRRGYVRAELYGNTYCFNGSIWTAEEMHGKPPHILESIQADLRDLNSEQSHEGTHSHSGLYDLAEAALKNTAAPKYWRILECIPDMTWHDELPDGTID